MSTTPELDHPDRPAHHWGIQTIYSAVVPLVPFPDDAAEVWVAAEDPRDAEGRTVAKRGNRWYPTTVHLVLDESMTPEAARAVARALLLAADVADSHDREDVDVCGHWAPCACAGKQAAHGG